MDSLEEQNSSGSFKSSGTNDLLTVAIGKPDHPCRVRGVGRGYSVHGNSEEMLQTRLGEGDFECFLAPIYENNWQLMVLCPKYSYVSWFCFMQNTPTKKITTKIETYGIQRVPINERDALTAIKKAEVGLSKVLRTREADEYGLFVMRHMLEIIKLDIVDSFEKSIQYGWTVFNG
ncbi:hypothetical protein CASFOL_037192 [Castilleja foliolosa]|uniref:Uncharacterized protein n=1 Tax=Castilleja foliolosa TaxID=1961234 RepID=A0ABD3BP34_9LAMI